MVDDTEGITELYHIFLHGAGYIVRSFDNRAEALAELTSDKNKPNLLIMDYLGDAMPADRFIQRCRSVHPALRILMASGFSLNEARFSCVRPDRFIQKPFTAEEFQEEVRAVLNGW